MSSHPGQTSEDGEFPLECPEADGFYCIFYHKCIWKCEKIENLRTICKISPCMMLIVNSVKKDGSILYHQLDWQTPEVLELHLQVPQTPDQSALQSWQPVLYSHPHPQSVCSHLSVGSVQHCKKDQKEWKTTRINCLQYGWSEELQKMARAKLSASESWRLLPRWFWAFSGCDFVNGW